MNKYLRVTMPDGSKWDVPATIIAENRALHYSDGDKTTPEYQEEYDYTLRNSDELRDWASNNMNWDDVVSFAVRVKEPDPVDYHKGWINADYEVIEK